MTKRKQTFKLEISFYSIFKLQNECFLLFYYDYLYIKNQGLVCTVLVICYDI